MNIFKQLSEINVNDKTEKKGKSKRKSGRNEDNTVFESESASID